MTNLKNLKEIQTETQVQVASRQDMSDALSNNSQDKILGLLAGEGKLPAILARSAKEKGYKIIALCIGQEAQASVEAHCEKTFVIAPGQLGRNLKILEQENVSSAVCIGKIPKSELLKNFYKLDWLAIKELSKLSNYSDDSIQKALGDILESKDIRVLGQAEFLTELFPQVGILTKIRPNAQQYADIEYGFKVAKEIARLDIGQTVIVRDRMILAVEAIEGTDRAIKRAVELAKSPVVVVKVAKSNHDHRFDTPAVGMSTLKAMIAPGTGGVLAVAANETMLVERENMIELAESQGIAIVVV